LEALLARADATAAALPASPISQVQG
jgi:hypothetical protein